MPPSTPSHSLPPIRTITDVACTRCGCVCDDLTVETDGERILKADRACEMARPWLEMQRAFRRPQARVEGTPVSLDQALQRAAQILDHSRSPLVYGLSRSSTPGQRAAVALADHLGATVDTTASRGHAPSIVALQQGGESTCTLGEARHRCDLVIFWGADPLVTHPRHGERYSLDPIGDDLPRGRADRTVWTVDIKSTATTAIADQTLTLERGRDFEVLWILRALVRDMPVAHWPEGIDRRQVEALAAAMRACRSGIVYFGLGLTRGEVGHANVEALLRLVTELNRTNRFYARRMRIPGDVAGADSVLCWQTGFPFSVNLAAGYPRFGPGEYSANAMLERGETDACLLLGSESLNNLSAAARQALEKIPTIILDPPSINPPFEPTVAISTAIYGIHTAGTAYRMDETPIPLRPILDCDGPSDRDVLEALLAATQRRLPALKGSDPGV